MSRHRRRQPPLPDLDHTPLPDWLRGATRVPPPESGREPDPRAGSHAPRQARRTSASASASSPSLSRSTTWVFPATTPTVPAQGGGAASTPVGQGLPPDGAAGALVAHSLDDLRLLQRILGARRQAELAAAARAAEAAAAERRAREVFVRAVGPITTMPDPGRHLHRPPPPEPVARQRDLDDAEVLRQSLSDDFDPHTLMETDDQLSYSRRGVGPDVLKQLRGGRWSVQGQIDLHGHTRDEAREALGGFLSDAGKRGWRCVRVVHGKGLGSPGRQPVLKGKVRSWLVQRQEVLAFAQATGPDGGAGALIVLLDSA